MHVCPTKPSICITDEVEKTGTEEGKEEEKGEEEGKEEEEKGEEEGKEEEEKGEEEESMTSEDKKEIEQKKSLIDFIKEENPEELYNHHLLFKISKNTFDINPILLLPLH